MKYIFPWKQINQSWISNTYVWKPKLNEELHCLFIIFSAEKMINSQDVRKTKPLQTNDQRPPDVVYIPSNPFSSSGTLQRWCPVVLKDTPPSLRSTNHHPRTQTVNSARFTPQTLINTTTTLKQRIYLFPNSGLFFLNSFFSILIFLDTFFKGQIKWMNKKARLINKNHETFTILH